MPDYRIHGAVCRAMVAGLTFGAWIIVVHPAAAQDLKDLVTIEDQIWGFDGRVTSGQFNPVSFLIDNRTDEPLDANAVLTRSAGLAGTTGGRIEQPVYIGGGARRWVQFYPYIESDNPTEWQLSIGPVRFNSQQQPRSTSIPYSDQKKKSRVPVVVILDAPGAMERAPRTVKHFPEDIFPPYGSATVGLRAVFMDHVPDWEEPRQAALIAWLRRGGRLVLLKGSRGGWPEFSGTLAELSQPLNRYYVGAGTVQRIDVSRKDLSEDLVDSMTGRDEPANPDEELEETVAEMNYGGGQYGYGYESPEWMDENWSQQLRQLTMPEHAWWLIFLLSLMYILLIFPGCWILAKQRRGFMTVYGAIAGVAVLFSVLFLMIGRRGYGEATTLNTIALSRIEGTTSQSVLEWNALFVTSGDQYTVQAPDEQALFAIPGQRERSNAVFREGNAGEVSVAIPPFSSQTFVCRRQRPIADWKLQMQDLQLSSSGLSRVAISVGPAFELLQPQSIVALYGNRVYDMRFEDDTKSLVLKRSLRSLAEYSNSYTENSYYMNYGWNSYGSENDESLYDKVMPGLVVRSVLGEGAGDLNQFRLPSDRIRLFVYADYPESERLTTGFECAKAGRILYVRDVLLDSGQSAN